MNKKMLIEEMAKNSDYSKAELERLLNMEMDVMKKIIKKHGKLQLIGFGTFNVKKRAARMGRNPQTGKEMKIKASKTVTFKVGKDFKSSL
ncbi:MAG: HU family DNA-binding protein [Candidatus ainarchaeum sp.]|nr:HU family DNA-binding protein [Candidatus ainarchaeum sp.]MDD3975964.1 HU family DNA-binding protein [Candidatus ainarchaeum sp.]